MFFIFLKNFKKVLLVFLLVFLFYPLTALTRTSNDPELAQWAYKDIGVFKAWDRTVGSAEVVVAVIDNGFDTFHPDLFDNVWKNEDEIENNGVDDDNNGYIDDVWGWNFVPADINFDGRMDEEELRGNNDPRSSVLNLSEFEKDQEIFSHGTLVAGLIGAVGDNDLGVVGLNWGVKLMNLKVIDNSGEGDLELLFEAIHYAVDNGADIINLSLASNDASNLLSLKEEIKRAYNSGVVVVAAVGNNMQSMSESPYYPACVDAHEDEQWLLGVSAIREDHRLAMFSNSGGDCIDLTAPGQNITSTVRYAPRYNLKTLYSGGWQGTSFSAPLVSGTAALIKAINPHWGAKEIYQALLSTVHHTPGQDEVIYKNLFGAGLLQVDKAVEYAWERRIDESYLQLLEKDTPASNTLVVDINDDGKEESIIAKDGQIIIYDSLGNLQRKFLAFDNPEKLNLILMALDFDRDGKQDLAVYARGSNLPIRIWNYKIKKIWEHQPNVSQFKK